MVDGLLINYNAAIPAEMHDLIVDSHHPSIWMNSKQHADCIYPDDYSGAKMIAQRMLALGHRRIAFVDFSNRNVEAPLHYSGTDRLAGVQDACSQAGATFIRHGWGELAAAGHETPVARDLLSGPDRPTAVVAYTMQEARFIRTAALDVRLDVPNDLSIAAIASGRARAYDRTISAASIPFYELGKQAVEMLHEKIDVPEASLEPRPLPMTWEEGDSMAEAPTDDEGNAA
jgi:LacI family transcriptional regulator